MKVIVNGESCTLEAGLDVSEMISLLGIQQQWMAIEINGEILPKSSYIGHLLVEGDAIEIIRAVGGG